MGGAQTVIMPVNKRTLPGRWSSKLGAYLGLWLMQKESLPGIRIPSVAAFGMVLVDGFAKFTYYKLWSIFLVIFYLLNNCKSQFAITWCAR